jgi:hypothetical protein
MELAICLSTYASAAAGTHRAMIHVAGLSYRRFGSNVMPGGRQVPLLLCIAC